MKNSMPFIKSVSILTLNNLICHQRKEYIVRGVLSVMDLLRTCEIEFEVQSLDSLFHKRDVVIDSLFKLNRFIRIIFVIIDDRYGQIWYFVALKAMITVREHFVSGNRC